MEFSEGAAGATEPGAALVSDLEFSDPGGVTVEEAGEAFVSSLLDCCGTGVPVPPAPGVAGSLGVDAVVSGAVVGAGAGAVLVVAGVMSLDVA